MTDYKELIAELLDRHNEDRYKILTLEAADAIEALLDFAHYVADKVTRSDEDWEDYHEAFAEVACRKLVKLGVVSLDDDMYVYSSEAQHD